MLGWSERSNRGVCLLEVDVEVMEEERKKKLFVRDLW